MFIIDPRPFQYALERTQAEYDLAKKQYDRALQLKKSSFIAAETIDQRYKEVETAKTQVDQAQLNLEFTQIRSPISGKISRYFVSVGNLIQMDDTILTRVVSLDPIHFYFETSQNDLLKYIRLAQQGKRASSENTGGQVAIKLLDEKEFVHLGKADFLDNEIDKETGTILGRAIVPNPQGILYPGLFGRARVAGSGEYDALLLPDKAINSEQTRKYVYIVDAKNCIQKVYVELGPLRDSGYYIIRSGLKGNENVVISGIQRLHVPGQEVNQFILLCMNKE